MELAIYIFGGIVVLAVLGYGCNAIVQQYKYQKKELQEIRNKLKEINHG